MKKCDSDKLEELKSSVCAVVDRHRDAVIELGSKVWARPETGFKEYETARLVAGLFNDAGLQCREGLALTGLRTELKGSAPGPTLAFLAEMDAIILPEHPDADPVTGAVHACGHNAQLAGLFGAALALSQSGIMENLAGKIVFMAVPAEEYLELEFRRELVRTGKIRFLGGKQEMIRLGHFDDVDLSMMIHTGKGKTAGTRSSMNGFTAQYTAFRGRASHAGLTPHAGVNALNAAMLALQAINAQRDTFQDQHHVRVHSILRKGGESVNTVPGEAVVETMVRAMTIEAIGEAALKAERAYKAGAMALGAEALIESFPGYLPLRDCSAIADVFGQNAARFVGEDGVTRGGHLSSSTDMGDVTQIMPASHPGLGGAEGGAHAVDYRIVDPDLAYVAPGKTLAMCAIDLLGGNAETARRIITENPPLVARENYVSLMEKQHKNEVFNHSAP